MESKEKSLLYAGHPVVEALGKVLSDKSVRTVFAGGLCASSAAMVFSALIRKELRSLGGTLLFVFDDADEAGYFLGDLSALVPEAEPCFFPSSFRRAVKYGRPDEAARILRTEVITRLSGEGGGRGAVVVTYAEALAERVVSPGVVEEQTVRLNVGQRIDITDLERSLGDLGFVSVDYVYEPGQFAVRGSLLDVFSYACEEPFRIDFFGDEVESIRSFDVQTQLSDGRCSEVVLIPQPKVDKSVDLVALTDFLQEDSIVVSKGLGYVCGVAQHTFEEGFSACKPDVGDVLFTSDDAVRLLVDGEGMRCALECFRHVEVGLRADFAPQAVVRFETEAQPLFHKNIDMVCGVFADLADRGYRVYVLADSGKQLERLEAVLAEKDSGVGFVGVSGTIHGGFVDHTLKEAYFTDHQIFDRFHKYRLRSDRVRQGKVALSLKELREFRPGDYVVHVDHGIGRFGGLVRIPDGDSVREAIKITYEAGAAVYVSIHSLHKVSKYRGREGETPRLSHLGTGAWQRLKDRTKKKIKDIARDLIRLYAKRREVEGFAFSADSFLQSELEAGFMFEDTPDQLKATAAVKADMERAVPMDRLICGDVGFGKTEVAVRAAFKACADAKQVAVLVPTTVLAYQHFRTFSERLRDMPVRVDYLSRARSAAQTKQILADLKEGRIDILVGTHKLISKNVHFKDLGLLIVDEEQKFGVAVKEKLRQIRTNVDTLTLTATPIPRTLQFSLMGARDLSVIQTPPPNRYPVRTEVTTYSDELMAEAVNFELSRGGQTFIVNNHINGLYDIAEVVRRSVPDARVAVAHGRMDTGEMERIVLDFASGDIDVLVSTSIIENGVDVPNANTIIVNSAQNFGLADLHQLRGRVGRSNRKAYCYLFAPPLSVLPQESRRRLQAIENFSDLGSGIHIALQDLDIRGAGNLLGAEQSGFIADLGYETYQKILSEAVHELKSDEFADLYAEEGVVRDELFVSECTLESDLPLCLPDGYVPGPSERMLLYRELDSLSGGEDIELFRSRLRDRFGAIPSETEELIKVVPLRSRGRALGVEKFILRGGRLTLCFPQNPANLFYQSDVFGRILSFASQNAHRTRLRESEGRRSMTVSGVRSVQQALDVLDLI